MGSLLAIGGGPYRTSARVARRDHVQAPGSSRLPNPAPARHPARLRPQPNGPGGLAAVTPVDVQFELEAIAAADFVKLQDAVVGGEIVPVHGVGCRADG